MNPVREHKIKLTRYALVGISCLLLFFISLPNYTNRLFLELWNLGHFALFFIITYAYLAITASKPSFKLIIDITIVSSCLALGTELVQLLVPNRSFSFADMVNDVTGSCVALSIHFYRHQRINMVTLVITMLLSTVIMFVFTTKVYRYLVDEIHMQSQFPELASFEETTELIRWRGRGASLSQEKARFGDYSLLVDNSENQSNGVSFKRFIGNWSRFSHLNISIWVDNKVDITIRIHDIKHLQNNSYSDRFNRIMSLESGWNDVSIKLIDVQNAPKSRKLDLYNIIHIGFFSARPSHVKRFFLDNIYLSNDNKEINFQTSDIAD